MADTRTRITDRVRIPVGSLTSADANKRVIVSSNALALAGATTEGVGTLDLPRSTSGDQDVVPRQPGRSCLMVTDEAVTAYDLLYAKANGLVGAQSAAEPLVAVALESVGAGGGTIECMWVDPSWATIVAL